MWKYITKRIAQSVVILFFVSMIIYAIMRCLPTSYIETIARERASLPGAKSYQEWLDQLNAVYKMDCGIIEGFFGWVSKAVRGEFGDSWYYNVPVTQKFASVIWDSFYIGAVAFILQIIIAIPLGILSMRRAELEKEWRIEW